MDDNRFESLISRLEASARDNPQRYLLSALAVILLGFVVLAVAMLFALIPVALFITILFAVVATGGKALIIFAKLGKLVVLLIVPAWVMIKSSMQMLFTRFPHPLGRELSEHEAPVLFARIDELRQRMKGPRIHCVLLTDELNAAILQYPRFGLFGWEKNYLILGLPLLQAMSEEEALSVVAHEYGHLSGHHSRLGGFIYRFRGAWGRMQALSEQWKDWGSRLITRLFQWYAPYFNAYTFVLARQNEYLADRISAEVAGARNTANALMRVNIATQFENEVFWPSIDKMVAKTPQPLGNRSHFWINSIHEQLDEQSRMRYLDIAGKWQTNHLDTHPAMRDRLQAIGVTLDESAAHELTPPLHNAAEIWFGTALQSIQEEFDKNWQHNATERWQERHQHLETCRQKLTELQAQETLTIDELWELILLTSELDSDYDALPKLNELLQQSPDHISARYKRGMLLLAQNDEAGIADLERVMEKDAGATLSACEAAWRFYLERDPELAGQYRKRWLTRSEYENSVAAEFQTLPVNATLAAHDLDAETINKISQIVQANGKYIRRAYIIRRILKTDDTLHDYVLAFETKHFTLGNKGPEVTALLSKQEYPVDFFIVHLGSEPYKRFRKRIKRLNIEPVIGSYNHAAQPLISVLVLCATLVLLSGTDVHAHAGDRFRCIPADGGESYTSPGSCRSNTDTREPLTEQEKANALTTEISGRAFVKCTAADGSYSKFVFTEECPSATDIRVIEYAKQSIQRTRGDTPPPENPTTPLPSPTPVTPESLASSLDPATLPSSASPARSGTGWVIKLGLLGLGVWVVFSWLGRRSDKSKAAEREAHAKAIAQKRGNPAPVEATRHDRPMGERIDMQQKSQELLAALASGTDVQGGLAFRSALQQSKLDYSMESLGRVDQLLSQIRTKFPPQRESWQSQPGAENFCLMLTFYLGEMISRLANQPIKWHTREQAAPFMPADTPLPEANWSRVVGIIAASTCVPLGVIEDALFGDSSGMTCKAYVEHRLAKLPKPPAKDENERCTQMLDAFFNDAGIIGRLAFREQLQLAQLDHSLSSLERLDQLLRTIRAEIKPTYEEFVNNTDTQNFLRLVAFYIGVTTARAGTIAVKWLDFSETKKNLPELELQFETTSVCLLDGRFYFLLGLVTEILFHPAPQRSVPGWASEALQIAPPPIPSILQSSVQSDSADPLDDQRALAIRKAGFMAAWSMFAVEGGATGAPTVFIPRGDNKGGLFTDFGFYDTMDAGLEAARSFMEGNPQKVPYQVMSFDGYANLHTGRTDALSIELRIYAGKWSSTHEDGFSMMVSCPYRNTNDPNGFAIYSPKLLECSAPAAMHSAIFKHFYLGIEEFKTKDFDWFKYLDERI